MDLSHRWRPARLFEEDGRLGPFPGCSPKAPTDPGTRLLNGPCLRWRPLSSAKESGAPPGSVSMSFSVRRDDPFLNRQPPPSALAPGMHSSGEFSPPEPPRHTGATDRRPRLTPGPSDTGEGGRCHVLPVCPRGLFGHTRAGPIPALTLGGRQTTRAQGSSARVTGPPIQLGLGWVLIPYRIPLRAPSAR